jgi:Holliday junction resolvasome RuvABC DNA-binding subunit
VAMRENVAISEITSAAIKPVVHNKLYIVVVVSEEEKKFFFTKSREREKQFFELLIEVST